MNRKRHLFSSKIAKIVLESEEEDCKQQQVSQEHPKHARLDSGTDIEMATSCAGLFAAEDNLPTCKISVLQPRSHAEGN
ncbi:hypothetical protein AVEN_41209-1 [Araneus ventricosus]|uniref:Uncharacterized protein n=1 Tax=Araneus ventricosus TaxID=182803 RepID=A0A4Y1ZVG6_ARAVE|nr:hypothetical protein AVEN_91816-1 [Araneus ventricosus]GBN18861.1 hypothetical protein AVEN_41209-1 [Araneus ventricosus]